jgi:uncharacterized membrane protein YkvA (DUF1232 family)
MENQFKDFYDILKENLESYKEEYEKFIDYSPDLFKLLTEILNIEEINSKDRLKISAAIAYFVVPYDVIPEQIYGPYGYVDDIFISTYVLKEILENLNLETLKELWKREEDLQEIVELCYNKSKKLVGEETQDILKYAGLIE